MHPKHATLTSIKSGSKGKPTITWLHCLSTTLILIHKHNRNNQPPINLIFNYQYVVITGGSLVHQNIARGCHWKRMPKKHGIHTTKAEATAPPIHHFIREAVAMKECLTTQIPTLKNFADMLTKVLYGKKRKDLVGGVLHFIYDPFE